jgi:hypothetical protein
MALLRGRTEPFYTEKADWWNLRHHQHWWESGRSLVVFFVGYIRIVLCLLFFFPQSSNSFLCCCDGLSYPAKVEDYIFGDLAAGVEWMR